MKNKIKETLKLKTLITIFWNKLIDGLTIKNML